MTRRKIQYWVIPPKSDSEFVAAMEDVLDIYALPYNKLCFAICGSRYEITHQITIYDRFAKWG